MALGLALLASPASADQPPPFETAAQTRQLDAHLQQLAYSS